jgi:hypothetical protein
LIDDPGDEYGGHGLSASSQDLLAVLHDIVSDSPKLLKQELVVALFTPQFIPGTPPYQVLNTMGDFMDSFLRGNNKDADLNQALGGIFLRNPLPEFGQPGGTLSWAGIFNTVWFANRNAGVAGWYGTQVLPFNDDIAMSAFRDFRTDLWKTAEERGLIKSSSKC